MTLDFDPTQYVTIEIGDDGKQYVTFDPHIIYPVTIERIRYVLQNQVFPDELIQHRVVILDDGTPEPQVSTDRAKRLLANARRLPDYAWDSALRHRAEFDSPIPYPLGVAPHDRPDIKVYAPAVRDKIQWVWDRGDALEVAFGWFHHALRIQIGGFRGRVLSGFSGEDKAEQTKQLAATVGTPEPAPRFLKHYQL